MSATRSQVESGFNFCLLTLALLLPGSADQGLRLRVYNPQQSESLSVEGSSKGPDPAFTQTPGRI